MNDESNGRGPTNGRNNRKRWRNILIGIAAVFLFAYAVQVTDVNLEEPLEPKRQENLVGLLRELARPDFFTYQNETRSIDMSVRMPCPEEVKASQIGSDGRVLLLAPNCASTTQDPLTLSGEGFPPDARGAVLWYPLGSSSVRALTEFRADDNGRFSQTFTMPDIRPSEEPQRIEVVEIVSRRISGLSSTTAETFSRIIETILMALMASTIGTILAVPISFLGARNLMSNVGAPLAAIMAAVVALPVGWFAGWQVGALLSLVAERLTTPLMLGLAPLLLAGGGIWVVVRWGGALMGATAAGAKRPWATAVQTIAIALLGFLALGVLARFGLVFGAWLDGVLGLFGFIGNFIYVISDFVWVFLTALVALLGALTAASYANRYGQEAVLNMQIGPARLLTLVLTGLGTAFFVFGLLYAVNWICLLGICQVLPQETLALLATLAVPAVVLGVLAGLLSLRMSPKRQMPIGMAIYSVTRTILNVLRAIEPVILGFVLVVWVGIGPFAGVMALILHSIADLGKLFSEQVENIEEGPLEAVTATGANRIQVINFAVVPQIVPHYLAFIFYRWDINVRMSTIIGFVGGGGIGLVLFRSTNLTQYRQASVMVIAIAVVVTVLDTISSRVRKRII